MQNFKDILEEFPDYIDYLPEGAIVRKVKVMGYMPEKQISKYPYIGMSKEEYSFFVKKATEHVAHYNGVDKKTKIDCGAICKLMEAYLIMCTVSEMPTIYLKCGSCRADNATLGVSCSFFSY